ARSTDLRTPRVLHRSGGGESQLAQPVQVVQHERTVPTRRAVRGVCQLAHVVQLAKWGPRTTGPGGAGPRRCARKSPAPARAPPQTPAEARGSRARSDAPARTRPR